MTDEKNEQAFTLDDRIKFLWDVIKRIDFYVGTTNFKVGLLVSYNLTVFATILLKGGDIVEGLNKNYLVWASSIILGLLALSSLLSLFFAFKTVFPYTNPRIDTNQPDSLFFFGDIKNKENSHVYHDKIKEVSQEEILADFCEQIYTLSSSTSIKFSQIKTAIRIILFAQLPAFLVLLACVLADTLMNRLSI